MKRRYLLATVQVVPMLISVIVGAIVLSDGLASLVPGTWKDIATFLIYGGVSIAVAASAVYVVTRPRRS